MAPATTIRPAWLSDFIEWAQVASPTVSITTSTRRASRPPDSTPSWAPSWRAFSRASSLRDVTVTWAPAWAASVMAAVETPPLAPWISTRSPGRSLALVKSIR